MTPESIKKTITFIVSTTEAKLYMERITLPCGGEAMNSVDELDESSLSFLGGPVAPLPTSVSRRFLLKFSTMTFACSSFASLKNIPRRLSLLLSASTVLI